MKVMLDGAVALDQGVWSVKLRPTDVQRLGGSPITQGSRSVVIAQHAELSGGALAADLEALRAVVVGTSDQALVILAGSDDATTQSANRTASDAEFDGSKFPGDADFLHEVAQLPRDAAAAGRELLALVRRNSPGSMKRGSRRNFSNSPDNFWYAVVQPTRGNISITVRGKPELFQPSPFDLKADRPGYTRFYLSRPSEVGEAFKIVSASRRRK